MQTRADKREFLIRSIGSSKALPSWVERLEDEQLDEFCTCIQQAMDKQMVAVDKMMNSMTQSIKYIPNVILHMLAKKYIEPQLSARLTHKMTMKQIVGLTKGMPVDYMAEVAACQTNHAFAAEIMIHMRKKDIDKIIQYLVEHYPVKCLDIASHLNADRFAMVAKYLHDIPEAYMTEERRETLQRLQSL